MLVSSAHRGRPARLGNQPAMIASWSLAIGCAMVVTPDPDAQADPEITHALRALTREDTGRARRVANTA